MVEEIRALAARIGRPLRFMEVCGTHTVAAFRAGIHSLLPDSVRLLSGPGCPVCVTPQGTIDAWLELARRPEVTLATYADMLRVTGATGSLERARGEGADVHVVLSALEALGLARRHPKREVVFAAVGFETTAPATAAVVAAARREGLANFSALTAHKLVVPAMRALLSDPRTRIDGYLCPGHVSVIIGARAYAPLVGEFRAPCVVAGFEGHQIVEGLLHLTRQVAIGVPRLENLYPEVVREEPQANATALLETVFRTADSRWRALGTIADSGLVLREAFAAHDAAVRFDIDEGPDREPPDCRCGEVITGRAEPRDCPLFGTACTPAEPVGPCMVSSEGTCQAWFRFRAHEVGAR
jgi:hydrogenase expression/formation protein HypD